MFLPRLIKNNKLFLKIDVLIVKYINDETSDGFVFLFIVKA